MRRTPPRRADASGLPDPTETDSERQSTRGKRAVAVGPCVADRQQRHRHHLVGRELKPASRRDHDLVYPRRGEVKVNRFEGTFRLQEREARPVASARDGSGFRVRAPTSSASVRRPRGPCARDQFTLDPNVRVRGHAVRIVRLERDRAGPDLAAGRIVVAGPIGRLRPADDFLPLHAK